METPYRETTVLGSQNPKYYTTSDWLGPGKIKITAYREATVLGKRYVGRPLCFYPMIHKKEQIPHPHCKQSYKS